MGEDSSRIRKRSGPQVMAAFRNATIGLLRTMGATNIAEALRLDRTRQLESGASDHLIITDSTLELSNYPKTGCNPRKIQDLRAFSGKALPIPSVQVCL